MRLSLVFTLVAALPAFGGQVLFSNFGPPGSEYQAGAWVINSGFSVGVGFSPSPSGYFLDEIDIPIFWRTLTNFGTPNVDLTVNLLGPYNSGQVVPGAPFNVIETWQVSSSTAPATNASILSLLSASHPQLTGQVYFLTLEAPGLGSTFQWAWATNNTNAKGWAGGSGGTWSFNDTIAPALQVIGSSSVNTGTPEPATFALTAAGILGAMLLRRGGRAC